MSNFWESRTGAPITGNPSDAYQPEFEIIPHGTMALASIKAFELVSKKINEQDVDFYQIIWKITSADYKGREVTQKIKAFDDKPEITQRALNMLKLIYGIANHIPKHANVPTDDDHKPLIGKIMGIKINEWQMPKKDGSGFREGNNVSEVHKAAEFLVSVGEKRELPKITSSAVDSAFNRNPPKFDSNDVPW